MSRASTFAVAAACLVACAARDVPRQASAPLTEPRVVARPPPAPCDEELLERITPWTGRVLMRTPAPVPDAEQSVVVHTDWVYCNALDNAECRAWAQQLGEQRAKERDLSVHVWDGHSVRGTWWVLSLRNREEGHLFATNRELVTFFRALTESGEHPAIVDSRRVVEARPARVEIEYRVHKKGAPLPASLWLFETSSDAQALVEATLAFEDLESRGVQVHSSSWAALHDAAREASGDGEPYPVLRAAPPAASSEPRRFWLEVRCPSG
jgi:hypothetical protein